MRLLATIVTLLGYVTAPTNSQISCGTVEGHGERALVVTPTHRAEVGYYGTRGVAEHATNSDSEYQASPAGITFAPKPEPKIAPIRPNCYIQRTDILTDDSPRPLIIRDWMACWKCQKFKECRELRLKEE